MVEYKAGVCNIGKKEIRKRYALATIAFVIAIILSYTVLSLNWSRFVLLPSFIFFLLGFEGLYQGYFRFCAGFAASGVYDFTGSNGSRGKVKDVKSHRKDMSMAMQIHTYSIISAILVTVIIYFVI